MRGFSNLSTLLCRYQKGEKVLGDDPIVTIEEGLKKRWHIFRNYGLVSQCMGDREAGEEETLMFERILKTFSKVTILVVGDIMMDRFIWGKVSRISPEAPVPVVAVEKETFLLGGAANVVNNIHALGGNVTLCGVVGDDEMGQKIVEKLSEMKIGPQGIFV